MRVREAFERHGIAYTEEQFLAALKVAEVWQSPRGTHHVQEIDRSRSITTLCGSLDRPDAEVVGVAIDFAQHQPRCQRCVLGLEVRRGLARPGPA